MYCGAPRIGYSLYLRLHSTWRPFGCGSQTEWLRRETEKVSHVGTIVQVVDDRAWEARAKMCADGLEGLSKLVQLTSRSIDRPLSISDLRHHMRRSETLLLRIWRTISQSRCLRTYEGPVEGLKTERECCNKITRRMHENAATEQFWVDLLYVCIYVYTKR